MSFLDALYSLFQSLVMHVYHEISIWKRRCCIGSFAVLLLTVVASAVGCEVLARCQFLRRACLTHTVLRSALKIRVFLAERRLRGEGISILIVCSSPVSSSTHDRQTLDRAPRRLRVESAALCRWQAPGPFSQYCFLNKISIRNTLSPRLMLVARGWQLP